MIKALMKVRIEGMYLNLIKNTYKKPIANTLLSGKKLKPFPLKSGTRQGCPLFPLLFNSLGIPSQSNKIGRTNKRNAIRKGRNQTIPICR
jgi:hypothetical protein